MIDQLKNAALALGRIDGTIKNQALKDIGESINKNRELILKENKKDIDNSKGLSVALVNRLKLNDSKISEMINGIKSLIALEDPVNQVMSELELDENLVLKKVSCPIGVIGAIFESRPDALVQIASLCFKSGNAVILKGGSEAMNSNKILHTLISNVTNKIVQGSIQLITSREEVTDLLKYDDVIDLIVPRGSNKFVKFIQDNSKIPVLGHSDGICHVYIDKDAKISKGVKVGFDAKTQYPAACNAMETLLVHSNIASQFLPEMLKQFETVKLKGCERTKKIIDVTSATEEDWKTEYGDMILSIKLVDSITDAINHINKYGSKHTDAIITENKLRAEVFQAGVDSSSVLWNCSTRFADGFRYGKGAEVGISTGKIHARGPVGLDGLTIYRYILNGNGHVVKDYSGKNARRFKHEKNSN